MTLVGFDLLRRVCPVELSCLRFRLLAEPSSLTADWLSYPTGRTIPLGASITMLSENADALMAVANAGGASPYDCAVNLAKMRMAAPVIFHSGIGITDEERAAKMIHILMLQNRRAVGRRWVELHRLCTVYAFVVAHCQRSPR